MKHSPAPGTGPDQAFQLAGEEAGSPPDAKKQTKPLRPVKPKRTTSERRGVMDHLYDSFEMDKKHKAALDFECDFEEGALTEYNEKVMELQDQIVNHQKRLVGIAAQLNKLFVSENETAALKFLLEESYSLPPADPEAPGDDSEDLALLVGRIEEKFKAVPLVCSYLSKKRDEVALIKKLKSAEEFQIVRLKSALEGLIVPELKRRLLFDTIERAAVSHIDALVKKELKVRQAFSRNEAIQGLPLDVQVLLANKNPLKLREAPKGTRMLRKWNRLQQMLESYYKQVDQLPGTKYVEELESKIKTAQTDLQQTRVHQTPESSPQVEAFKFENEFLKTELQTLKDELKYFKEDVEIKMILLNRENSELREENFDLKSELANFYHVKEPQALSPDQFADSREESAQATVRQNIDSQLKSRLEEIQHELQDKDEIIEEQSLKIEDLKNELEQIKLQASDSSFVNVKSIADETNLSDDRKLLLMIEQHLLDRFDSMSNAMQQQLTRILQMLDKLHK